MSSNSVVTLMTNGPVIFLFFITQVTKPLLSNLVRNK